MTEAYRGKEKGGKDINDIPFLRAGKRIVSSFDA